MTKYLFLVLAALVIQSQADKLTRHDEEVKIFENILAKHPDSWKIIRPPGHHTNVTVNFLIRNVLSVHEDTHRWKVHLIMRHEWTDSRLAFHPTHNDLKYLLLNDEKHIWRPDIFFPHEIHAEEHNLMRHNVLVRVHPDGHVKHSKRLTLELTCPSHDMDKKVFNCPIKIASFGHTTDELELHWHHEEPVQVKKNIWIKHHALHGVTTTKCESETHMGKFSCIVANVKLGKESACHMED